MNEQAFSVRVVSYHLGQGSRSRCWLLGPSLSVLFPRSQFCCQFKEKGELQEMGDGDRRRGSATQVEDFERLVCS